MYMYISAYVCILVLIKRIKVYKCIKLESTTNISVNSAFEGIWKLKDVTTNKCVGLYCGCLI